MRLPSVPRLIAASLLVCALGGALRLSTPMAMAQSVDADPKMDWSSMPGQAGRPHAPWAFRCTFNGTPRAFVAALAPSCWVVYDGSSCALDRVWNGGTDGIELDGSVYTGNHGPNPTQKGPTLFEGVDGAFVVVADGKTTDVPATWKGYRIREGHVELLFDVAVPSGNATQTATQTIRVTERPEFVAGPKGQALERRFSVSAAPANGALGLRVPAKVETTGGTRAPGDADGAVITFDKSGETTVSMTLPASRGGAK
ncbi:MAG: hypothetical protein JNM94_11940 [Phycisphaerae bacterium]|nr:hypothetical protein [Phycisphaerae bacterium]